MHNHFAFFFILQLFFYYFESISKINIRKIVLDFCYDFEYIKKFKLNKIRKKQTRWYVRNSILKHHGIMKINHAMACFV